jgi:hypothetical protein
MKLNSRNIKVPAWRRQRMSKSCGEAELYEMRTYRHGVVGAWVGLKGVSFRFRACKFHGGSAVFPFFPAEEKEK